jgi:hypothetical protein
VREEEMKVKYGTGIVDAWEINFEKEPDEFVKKQLDKSEFYWTEDASGKYIANTFQNKTQQLQPGF